MYFEDIFFWTCLGILLQFLMVCVWGLGVLYCLAKITKYRRMVWGFLGCLGLLLCTLADILYNTPQFLAIFWNHLTQMVTAQAKLNEALDYLHLYYRWEGMQITCQLFLVAALAGHFKYTMKATVADQGKKEVPVVTAQSVAASEIVAYQSDHDVSTETAAAAGASVLAGTAAATEDEDRELAVSEAAAQMETAENEDEVTLDAPATQSTAEVEEESLPDSEAMEETEEKTAAKMHGKSLDDGINEQELRAIKEEETLQDYNIKKDFMEARPGDFTMAMLDKNQLDDAPQHPKTEAKATDEATPANDDTASNNKSKVVPWIFPTATLPLHEKSPRIENEPEDGVEDHDESKTAAASQSTPADDEEYLETKVKPAKGAGKKKAVEEDKPETEDDEYMDIAEQPKKAPFQKLQKKKFGEEMAEDNTEDPDKKFGRALLKNLIPEGEGGDKKPKKGGK